MNLKSAIPRVLLGSKKRLRTGVNALSPLRRSGVQKFQEEKSESIQKRVYAIYDDTEGPDAAVCKDICIDVVEEGGRGF